MKNANPIEELFNTLLEDGVEKKILSLIINGKQSDEIIKNLLKIDDDYD
jgi:hypothetical protein